MVYGGTKTCYVYGVDGARLMKIEGLPAGQADCTATAGSRTTLYVGAAEIRDLGVVGEETVLTYPHPNVRLVNGTTTAAANYLHLDHLGSVRAVTDGTGAKLEWLLYGSCAEKESSSGQR